jgi:CRP-like cAMP-binding protein/CheY-like chemotaxis protein
MHHAGHAGGRALARQFDILRGNGAKIDGNYRTLSAVYDRTGVCPMLIDGLSKPKILVIEDNSLVADAICDLVRDCGCDVAGSVGYVHHGVQFLSDCTVDGAVVDINLHGALSFPICDELQRRKVPFFFLSGYAVQSNVPAQFRSARFLTKPVDTSQFRSALAEFRPQPANDRTPKRWGNALLDELDNEDMALLEAKLERVALREGQVIEAATQPATYVHFITSGLVSLMARCPRGQRIELTLLGAEAAAGIAALLDGKRTSLFDAVVQVSGGAWRIATDDLRAIMRKHPSVQDHVLNHVHSLVAQIAETTLATGYAKIEQRLARWLLLAAERCGTHKLPVTHEQLSRSLAVRRSGITVALHILESRHLIRSQRKLVEILDKPGLMREFESWHGWSESSAMNGGTPVGLRDQENQAAG